MRNNEVYGDMTAWIAAHAGDNESDLMRLKRNLRLAREEELTARQRELPEKEATVQQRFCKIAHQQRNQQRKHRGHKRAE